MQSFKQLNKTYKCKQKNYNILTSINLTSSQSFVLHLASMYFSWCQHFHLILFLLFNRLCMQQSPTFCLKLVDSVCGLNELYFFDYFAFNFCMMAQVFFCQISLDNSISFLYSCRLYSWFCTNWNKHFLITLIVSCYFSFVNNICSNAFWF